MSLRKNCPECGQGYEAKKATSKYCSGTCRQRAFRDKRREQLEKQSRMHVDSIERDLAAYGFSPVQIARLRTLAYDHEDTVTLAIGRYDPTGQMLKARESDYAQMAGCIKWGSEGEVERFCTQVGTGCRPAGERERAGGGPAGPDQGLGQGGH